MKRVLSVILAILLAASCSGFSYASEEYPVKRENVNVRDPYILVHDGKYYMYGTCLAYGKGYGCCVSEDMENWSERIQIFTPDDNSDMEADFWAPECHYYNGSFYLFATYRSKASGKRGTAIFKSESPTGQFELWSDGHITPKEIDCIDGTLYIDKNGQPWMVYVNEWTSSPDEVGEMAAAKLSEDFKTFISEPIMLFRARKHIWTTGSVTDGPAFYRTENGRLIMLWSNLSKSGGYAVGMAVSDNGEIDGNWIHYPEAFYEKGDAFELDGGHPMLFYTLDGKLMLSIHSPNERTGELFETVKFLELEDTGNMLRIKDKYTFGDAFYRAFFEFYYSIISVWCKFF
ncbi:MAG: family 43 glycosylhydrolase [Clostridia bacterium]|nr:family 43 glycosylhydrolase [Clostridia bacterium]